MARPPVRSIERRPADADLPEIEIVRSTRRRRSATAFTRDGRIVVQLPAGLPSSEEERLIGGLVGRVSGRARAAACADETELMARAHALADRYLDGVRPTAVRWSSRMQRRYGSCTADTGEIRISDRVARYPVYVQDYVLVHELAHLVVPDHSAAFRALVDRYPDAPRARGFLEGLEFAGALPPTADADPSDLPAHMGGDGTPPHGQAAEG